MEASIVMTVFNTKEEFLREAIESILNQSYKDFEFIIIDDKSTDNTYEIVNEYATQDNRIILQTNSGEKGIGGAANAGMRIAKGKYILRMDSDDISLPNRIETQISWMNAHPNIGVMSSRAITFGDGMRDKPDRGGLWKDYVIKSKLLYGSPITNAASIIRRDILLENSKIYDEESKCEDYDLWVRLAQRGVEFARIKTVLFKRRRHSSQVTAKNDREESHCRVMVNYFHGAGTDISLEQAKVFKAFMYNERKLAKIEMVTIKSLYKKLLGADCINNKIKHMWMIKYTYSMIGQFRRYSFKSNKMIKFR